MFVCVFLSYLISSLSHPLTRTNKKTPALRYVQTQNACTQTATNTKTCTLRHVQTQKHMHSDKYKHKKHIQSGRYKHKHIHAFRTKQNVNNVSVQTLIYTHKYMCT